MTMDVKEVYLLDDKAWMIADMGTIGIKLYVVEHKETPILVTKTMAANGDVPQEIIDWYRGE